MRPSSKPPAQPRHWDAVTAQGKTELWSRRARTPNLKYRECARFHRHKTHPPGYVPPAVMGWRNRHSLLLGTSRRNTRRRLPFHSSHPQGRRQTGRQRRPWTKWPSLGGHRRLSQGSPATEDLGEPAWPAKQSSCKTFSFSCEEFRSASLNFTNS